MYLLKIAWSSACAFSLHWHCMSQDSRKLLCSWGPEWKGREHVRVILKVVPTLHSPWKGWKATALMILPGGGIIHRWRGSSPAAENILATAIFWVVRKDGTFLKAMNLVSSLLNHIITPLASKCEISQVQIAVSWVWVILRGWCCKGLQVRPNPSFYGWL